MAETVRRRRCIALVVTVGVMTAGCSSGGGAASVSASAAGPVTSAVTSGAASAPAETTAAVAEGDECGTAHDAADKALAGLAGVTSFEIGAGCDVTISTTLTQTDAKSLAICEAASKAGYAVGAKSVTVHGAADRELAISIKGQKCIGSAIN